MPKENTIEEKIKRFIVFDKAVVDYSCYVIPLLEMDDLTHDIRRQALEECIKLSDEIESREPDGGTKQWMAFKAFRNTMRDRISEKKSNIKGI